MGEVTAYIGAGSNQGNREVYLWAAIQKLAETPGISGLRQSTIMETKPIGPIQDQPNFLNTVLEVKTTLSALEILDVLLGIEAGLGRVRAERWGPRTIDLDLLRFGDQVIDNPRLKVPHPEIANRPFIQDGLRELSTHG